MTTQFTANNIKSLFCTGNFPCQIPLHEQPGLSTPKLIFISIFGGGFLGWLVVVFVLFMILIIFSKTPAQVVKEKERECYSTKESN